MAIKNRKMRNFMRWGGREIVENKLRNTEEERRTVGVRKHKSESDNWRIERWKEM